MPCDEPSGLYDTHRDGSRYVYWRSLFDVADATDAQAMAFVRRAYPGEARAVEATFFGRRPGLPALAEALPLSGKRFSSRECAMATVK